MTNKKHKKKLKRAAKLKKQMNMFDRLPEACNTCGEEFPKTREAHMTWRVTVRNKEQQVRLFCPDCLEKAKEFVEEHNEV